MRHVTTTLWLSLFTAIGASAADPADALKDTDALPEAAAMFERLVRRIPANVDPVEANEYVGQEFNYVLHTHNAAKEETAMVPFIVGGRLYCIHFLRTRTPSMSIHRIDKVPPKYEPQSDYAKGVVSRDRKPTPSLAMAADLHAILDNKAANSVKIECVPISRSEPRK